MLLTKSIIFIVLIAFSWPTVYFAFHEDGMIYDPDYRYRSGIRNTIALCLQNVVVITASSVSWAALDGIYISFTGQNFQDSLVINRWFIFYAILVSLSFIPVASWRCKSVTRKLYSKYLDLAIEYVTPFRLYVLLILLGVIYAAIGIVVIKYSPWCQ